MDIRLLGPLEVAGPSGPIRLARPKERALLAYLALNLGQAVSDDKLIDALWGEDPPRTATKTLQSYVSRLRRVMAMAGAEVAIETTPGGYTLLAGPESLDIARVEDLLEQARGASERGDHAWAAVVLAEALRAFRGAPLGELAEEPWARTEAVRLTELQFMLLEERVEAELACGRHAALVAELEALCSAHPLRERLWEQRMLALYRSGRQAEALRVYQEIRRLLGEELGIDPSPKLQDLEQSILAQDPSLAWTPPAGLETASVLPARGVELPAGVVTFLLTDIEGSTALWESNAAAMATALVRHDELIAQAVGAAGGRIIKSKGEGDSTLSVFVRASDAATAAIALQRALDAEPWPEGVPLRVRTALHTGEAELRGGDYYGRTLNRAARLRSVATGGQVLCSRAAAELIADLLPEDVELVELGRHELRDLARAEHIFELVYGDAKATTPGTGATARGVEPLPSPLDSSTFDRFVGRHEELRETREVWEAVRGGSCAAVVIAGEPGIGKSALAAALAREAHADGAVILYGRCDEDVGIGYQPFAHALGTHFESISVERLRAHVGPRAADVARLVPQIAERLTGLPSPLSADPELERLWLFEGVADVLCRMGADAPTVLVIDDLQWATKATLLMLRHLLRSPNLKRVLIVATYRDTELAYGAPLAEALSEWLPTGAVRRIRLAGLAKDEITDYLVASQVDADDVGDLAATIEQETGGNAFFVKELVRELVAGRAAASELHLPESAKHVVSRRIARLSPLTQEAICAAAVLGQRFDIDLLEATTELPERDVIAAIDEATAARILSEAPRRGSYEFAHGLIRTVVYDELSSLRRARLHRCVASSIEQLRSSNLQRHWAELAHHYFEGAQLAELDKAVEYSRLAGEQATALLAHEEAVHHFDRGLAALESAEAEDLSRTAELLIAKADALWRAGERDDAESTYTRAREAARKGDAPELFARAVLGGNMVTPGVAVFPLTEESSALEELLQEALAGLPPGNAALRSRLMARLALARYWSMDRAARVRDTREAVEIARGAGDNAAVIAAVTALRFALWGPDDVEERLRVADEVLDLASHGEHVDLAIQAHYWKVWDLLELGQIAEADAEIDVFRRLAEELRQPYFIWHGVIVTAVRALMRGAFADAEALVNRAFELGGRLQDPAATSTWGGQSLVLWWEQGRDAEMNAAMDAIAGGMVDIPGIHAGLAFVASQTGHREEALAAVEDLATPSFEAIPRDLTWFVSMALTAQAVATIDDREHAKQLLPLIEPYADRLVAIWPIMCLGPGARFVGILHGAMGNIDVALRYLDSAQEMTERIEAPPFTARVRYDRARLLLARSGPGDRKRGEAEARAAASIAAELGMVGLEAECQRLLDHRNGGRGNGSGDRG